MSGISKFFGTLLEIRVYNLIHLFAARVVYDLSRRSKAYFLAESMVEPQPWMELGLYALPRECWKITI